MASLLLTSFPINVAAAGTTQGYVVTVWDPAFWQSADGKEECPSGLQYSEDENFQALDKAQRDANQQAYGITWNRGPNGENGAYVPTAVTDTLPWRDLESKTGYGFDLSGSTVRTCAHDRFTDPDGQKVDHQLYRVMGCTKGYRNGGGQQQFILGEYQSDSTNRLLIEISGIDDPMNDDAVEVHFHKGLDPLQRDSANRFLVNSSHRIDAGLTKYSFKVNGRIVNGELLTDPLDVARFSLLYVQMPGNRVIRDMRLRLKLSEAGGKGLIGGYEDVKNWWNIFSRGPGGPGLNIGGWSPATLYRQLYRFADGYPDANGVCTAISTAYHIEAVKAYIIHPHANERIAAIGPAATKRRKGSE